MILCDNIIIIIIILRNAQISRRGANPTLMDPARLSSEQDGLGCREEGFGRFQLHGQAQELRQGGMERETRTMTIALSVVSREPNMVRHALSPDLTPTLLE